jgi:hypothetical protein
MYRAIFAVELYDSPWSFGDVVFEDVTVTALDVASGWCKSHFTWGTMGAWVEGLYEIRDRNIVTCKFHRLTLSAPK